MEDRGAILKYWLTNGFSRFYTPFYEQDEAFEGGRNGLKASPWA